MRWWASSLARMTRPSRIAYPVAAASDEKASASPAKLQPSIRQLTSCQAAIGDARHCVSLAVVRLMAAAGINDMTASDARHRRRTK